MHFELQQPSCQRIPRRPSTPSQPSLKSPASPPLRLCWQCQQETCASLRLIFQQPAQPAKSQTMESPVPPPGVSLACSPPPPCSHPGIHVPCIIRCVVWWLCIWSHQQCSHQCCNQFTNLVIEWPPNSCVPCFVLGKQPFRPLFRRTFAELSRKFPSPQTPAISSWRIKGKANTRGLVVWLSQSLTFGSLAAAFGTCFLRLQKSNVRQYQRQVQGCASEVGCYLWRERSMCGTILLPDPRAAGGGSPWQAVMYTW